MADPTDPPKPPPKNKWETDPAGVVFTAPPPAGAVAPAAQALAIQPQAAPETEDPPPKPGRRGAHEKLTPKRHKLIIDALKIRPHLDAAFKAARITARCGFNWLARGRAELARIEEEAAKGVASPKPLSSELRYMKLAEDIEFARDRLEEDLALVVRNDAVINPQTAMWMLIRCFPDRWQDQVRITIDNVFEQFMELLGQEFSAEPEILERVLRIAVQLGGRKASREAGGRPSGANAGDHQPRSQALLPASAVIEAAGVPPARS